MVNSINHLSASDWTRFSTRCKKSIRSSILIVITAEKTKSAFIRLLPQANFSAVLPLSVLSISLSFSSFQKKIEQMRRKLAGNYERESLNHLGYSSFFLSFPFMPCRSSLTDCFFWENRWGSREKQSANCLNPYDLWYDPFTSSSKYCLSRILPGMGNTTTTQWCTISNKQSGSLIRVANIRISSELTDSWWQQVDCNTHTRTQTHFSGLTIRSQSFRKGKRKERCANKGKEERREEDDKAS